MVKHISYKQFGSKAILVEWQPIISDEILQDILLFKSKINLDKNIEIIDLVQGYNSLTVVYKNDIIKLEEKVKQLQAIYKLQTQLVKQQFYQWEIPVCYDLQFGIDLEEMAENSKVDLEEIIRLHSEALYRIYFIGFLPGFLYLGGLNSNIFFDRRPNPRLNIPKGTLAIGGKQTGIYPNSSAGGWNIIGRTAINFFDAENENPCFAKAGDYIKFNGISIEEFKELEIEISENRYKPIKTLYNA